MSCRVVRQCVGLVWLVVKNTSGVGGTSFILRMSSLSVQHTNNSSSSSNSNSRSSSNSSSNNSSNSNSSCNNNNNIERSGSSNNKPTCRFYSFRLTWCVRHTSTTSIPQSHSTQLVLTTTTTTTTQYICCHTQGLWNYFKTYFPRLTTTSSIH